jgi:hypothetical protein
VTVELGQVPNGATPGSTPLTAYKDLKLQAPLPSATQTLVVFRGVTAKGKSATFTLVGEAPILTGVGACLPSAAQCEALDLKPDESEQLSYLQANGETVTWELRVVSIAPVNASASSAKASAASASHAGPWLVSKAGRELLRRAGLMALPFLHYSSTPGVLVFASPRAKHAHAHR